ncbi:YdeI/OmpD-associated family protein, partial [Runella limosa]|uniref:YdeI/OmpD-associated family protein n=1 Tax=Runella limosa TaxID=370978 RepID=UPI0004195472
MSKQQVEYFYPETKQHWRMWSEKNHIRKDAVWLIYHKNNTGKPTLNWSDAVDEALCFGWIDSKAETIDKNSFRQYFCKRKPSST